ncbi:MAG: hypothetical protein KatS3mg042_0384 [Rhodothermaceae bacterium]|nr:MAG: hypothetical protein KatS3mg042_0384 [Rhodothermaceae bacterium]
MAGQNHVPQRLPPVVVQVVIKQVGLSIRDDPARIHPHVIPEFEDDPVRPIVREAAGHGAVVRRIALRDEFEASVAVQVVERDEARNGADDLLVDQAAFGPCKHRHAAREARIAGVIHHDQFILPIPVHVGPAQRTDPRIPGVHMAVLRVDARRAGGEEQRGVLLPLVVEHRQEERVVAHVGDEDLPGRTGEHVEKQRKPGVPPEERHFVDRLSRRDGAARRRGVWRWVRRRPAGIPGIHPARPHPRRRAACGTGTRAPRSGRAGRAGRRARRGSR